MLVTPKTVSQTRTSGMLVKILAIWSMKPDDLNLRPKRPLSCEPIIMTEVADVNPEVTGSDMKSTRKPAQLFLTLDALVGS